MDGERRRMKAKRLKECEGKERSWMENRKETEIKQEWCRIQKDYKSDKGGEIRGTRHAAATVERW